jgi:hypothetical protein
VLPKGGTLFRVVLGAEKSQGGGFEKFFNIRFEKIFGVPFTFFTDTHSTAELLFPPQRITTAPATRRVQFPKTASLVAIRRW